MPSILNNRYQIISTLGSGGFGETFLAEDIHLPSRRRCVIKQLKPIANNPQIYNIVKERFQREAAILEELGSGNNQIPSLYAYFELDSQFYLVQELIEGVTLTSKMQQSGILSETSVREILTNILPVLDYIHKKGIIHRDIKPDNIILRSSDNLPVLIDFGAVRETMGTVVNSQGNPTSSIVIGTPGFMPSEQAAGRPVYSSDLYSLGLTAIYLLTGKTPEQLETDSRTGEIIWREYAPLISPNLGMVIDKAIMSHPRDRYSSAMEMLQALQHKAQTVSSSPSFSQTTVVSPPPVFPSSNQTIPPTSSPSNQDNSKTIILGSLIVGGLISASVVFGMILTRSPESSSENTTTQQALLPSPSVTTKPIESPIQNTVNPSPSPSIIRPTPQPVNRPSPKQAIPDYYSLINNAQYETAWKHLSSQFRNNSQLHPNGYISYVDWWQTVNFVEIQEVRMVEEGAEVARVETRLKYLMKSGREASHYLRFRLVWDAETNNWLIDETKSI
ncbi:MAG TPA: serine/threonine protein kinase [Cyanobacteria bacterium UBA11149]|nr:serine/threonine protein kinase [Cyanobacteria bacterium UBA11367]HBE56651.1 serine/threonine protein kinase [Cyanobacteria bacterium UBA11366]HBK66351.1 serine/threonine protein kinase [Cyanobacteria bacterium UBA11166]HBR74117.1 serine/threonine protein kinase [Cyanobacteria bacterium UBA11159]HBS71356.1 serine/threonine protein kinase [Cyanobacteria bacterium UBA11153]HBW88231.1 serine/threonine protein kinase [Cyanobacteria bacterium UBA11149]HCA95101.1 serine/threonine protein kinase 